MTSTTTTKVHPFETTEAAREALALWVAKKYRQAKANGATEDQALKAVRSLWLEAIGAN